MAETQAWEKFARATRLLEKLADFSSQEHLLEKRIHKEAIAMLGEKWKEQSPDETAKVTFMDYGRKGYVGDLVQEEFSLEEPAFKLKRVDKVYPIAMIRETEESGVRTATYYGRGTQFPHEIRHSLAVDCDPDIPAQVDVEEAFKIELPFKIRTTIAQAWNYTDGRVASMLQQLNEFFDSTTVTTWRGYGHNLGGANAMIATFLANHSKKFNLIDAATFGALRVMDVDGDKYLRKHNIIPISFMYADDPVARFTAVLHTLLNARYTVQGPVWPLPGVVFVGKSDHWTKFTQLRFIPLAHYLSSYHKSFNDAEGRARWQKAISDKPSDWHWDPEDE